jgi:hypothetical protein
MHFVSDAQRRAVFARISNETYVDPDGKIRTIPGSIHSGSKDYLEKSGMRTLQEWITDGSADYQIDSVASGTASDPLIGLKRQIGELQQELDKRASLTGSKGKKHTGSTDSGRDHKRTGSFQDSKGVTREAEVGDGVPPGQGDRRTTGAKTGDVPIYQTILMGGDERSKSVWELLSKMSPEQRASYLEDYAKLHKQHLEQSSKIKLEEEVLRRGIPIAMQAGAYGLGAAAGGLKRVAGIPGEIAGGAMQPVRAIGRGIQGVAEMPGQAISGVARSAGGMLSFAGREAGETAQAFGRGFGQMAGGMVRELPILLRGLAEPKGEIYSLSRPFLQQYSTPTPVSQMKPLGGIEVPPGAARFRGKLWGDYGF